MSSNYIGEVIVIKNRRLVKLNKPNDDKVKNPIYKLLEHKGESKK